MINTNAELNLARSAFFVCRQNTTADPSVEELAIDRDSFDERDPSFSWAPDERSFLYAGSGGVFQYDLERGESKPLFEGSHPRWAPNGKWISFRSPDGYAFLIEPKLGARRPLMAGRRIRGALHWSPDSQYLFFSEDTRLIDQLFHFLTASRFVVYRISDGAAEPFLWTPGTNDRFFDWPIVPPQLRTN